MSSLLICLIFTLIFVAVANGQSSATEQEKTKTPGVAAPAPTPAPAGLQPANKNSESRLRRQGYLRFIEAQRLKGEAQHLRSAHLLEDAVKAYKDAIQADPNSPEPHIDLGELYFFYLSRRDLALREAEEAVRLDPKSVGGHLLLARLFISAAKMENNDRSVSLDRAIGEYEKAAELDPTQTEAWALLSELYQMSNQPERQITALEKWVATPLASDNFFYRWLMNNELASGQAYLQLSQIYLGKGKNQAAIEAARRGYESDPEASAYVRNLIVVLRAGGTSQDELRIYSQLAKTASSPALLIGYGSALVRAGRYGEAVERLREYLKLDPTNAGAVGLLAIAQRRGNQRPAAVETLKAGLARVEANTRADLVIELAETYEELGRNEEAIAQYEQIFETYLAKGALTPVNLPLFSEVVNRLLRVCRRVGNQFKLQSVMTRTRRVIDEHNPLLDLAMIESLREEGKRREALELAQSAGRRNSEDRALKFTEALILTEMKRFKEGADLLQHMITGEREQATDDAGAYLILSSVQMQAGDLKAAEESARKALELNPDDSEITIQLGSVLDRAGRRDQAEKLMRQLLTRDPSNATALNNLGYQLIERGNRDQEALKLIERAVAIEPINGSFLDSLGWAHYKVGNLEKARENLEKAMIYSKRNPTIHEHLGDVLRDQGRVAEARRLWEKALDYSIEADEIARIKVKLKDGR